MRAFPKSRGLRGGLRGWPGSVAIILAAVLFAASASAQTRVVFTDPPDSSTAVRDAIVEFINSAQNTLDVAIYTLTYGISGGRLTDIAGALQAARSRGVALRLVTDVNEETGTQFTILDILSDGVANGVINRGVVRSGNPGGIMHNKFMVADGWRVLTGSTNFTSAGCLSQENNVLILEGQGIAAAYTAEFEEMWNGIYGNRGQPTFPNSFFTNDGVPVEVRFGPDDDLTGRITTAIYSANRSVYFLVNVFSEGTRAYEIAEALKWAAAQGIDVRGVFDEDNQSSAQWNNLVNVPGISLGDYIGGLNAMHNKLMIVDAGTPQAKVFVGSNNWSNAADLTNDENLAILSSQWWSNHYYDYFRRLYVERSSDANGTQPVRRYGDMDGDGALTYADYAMALALASTGNPASPYQLLVGDVEPYPGVGGHIFGDGRIDAADARWIGETLGIVTGDDRIGESLLKPPGSPVSLAPCTVTAVFGQAFYIQQDDRSAGIRVETSGAVPARGQRVAVRGILKALNGGTGERYVEAQAVSVQPDPGAIPAPLTLRAVWMGGASPPGGYTRSVAGGQGLYNTGLRVRCAGKVTGWGSLSFWLDDGSGYSDGYSGLPGVKVISGFLARPALGSFVTVDGISTMEYVNGQNVRVLRPSLQSDIRVLVSP